MGREAAIPLDDVVGLEPERGSPGRQRGADQRDLALLERVAIANVGRGECALHVDELAAWVAVRREVVGVDAASGHVVGICQHLREELLFHRRHRRPTIGEIAEQRQVTSPTNFFSLT